MTDFIHTETAGGSGTAFSTWWNVTVPATVPVDDRYIFQIGTQDLDEHPVMVGKQIDGAIVIRPVLGEGHTGVRFTGREIRRLSNDPTQVFNHECSGTGQIIIEDMEIRTPVNTTTSSGRIVSPLNGNTVDVVVQRCLITNTNSALTRPIFASNGTGDFILVSSRFYQVVENASTRYFNCFYDGTTPRNFVVQGNVFQGISDIQRGVQLEFGVNSIASSVFDVQGNIVLNTTEDYRVVNNLGGDGTVLFVQNVSEDLTGQVTGATLAADLISFDNPDVKAGSIALIVWSNKPKTFGADFDIRGFDRTVVAGTANWDAGSMQFSSSDVASDINLNPPGATLQIAAFNDVVDLRHPLTLIPEDSGTLQIIRTGVAVPVVTGPDKDIILSIISDPEEDQLFPIQVGESLAVLIDAPGDISLAPVGVRLNELRFTDDLSLSILDTDEQIGVVGDQFSAVVGAGAPSFIIQDNDVILAPAGDGLQLASSDPDVTVSIPLNLVDNPDAGGLIRGVARNILADVFRDVVFDNPVDFPPAISAPVQAVFDRMSALSQTEKDAIEAMVDGLVSDGIWSSMLEFYAPCLNGTDFLTGFIADTLVESAVLPTHVPGEGIDFLTNAQHVLEGRAFAGFAPVNGVMISGAYSEFLAVDDTANSDYGGLVTSADEASLRWRGTDTTDYNTKYNVSSVTPRMVLTIKSDQEVWMLGWDGTDVLLSAFGANIAKATRTFQGVPATHPWQWHGKNQDGVPAAGNLKNMRFSVMFHVDLAPSTPTFVDMRTRVLQFLRDIGVTGVPIT